MTLLLLADALFSQILPFDLPLLLLSPADHPSHLTQLPMCFFQIQVLPRLLQQLENGLLVKLLLAAGIFEDLVGLEFLPDLAVINLFFDTTIYE